MAHSWDMTSRNYGRIGEVDGLIADLADFEEVFDIELVNRIKGHARFHVKRLSR